MMVTWQWPAVWNHPCRCPCLLPAAPHVGGTSARTLPGEPTPAAPPPPRPLSQQPPTATAARARTGQGSQRHGLPQQQHGGPVCRQACKKGSTRHAYVMELLPATAAAARV